MTGRIAFLGLGRMGEPMAHRLLATGHETIVWNRSGGRAMELTRMGAHRAPSAAEAARDAKTIVLMLSDGPAVESVLSGDAGVIAGLSAGTLVIDCSTVGPEHARRFASLVRQAGCARHCSRACSNRRSWSTRRRSSSTGALRRCSAPP